MTSPEESKLSLTAEAQVNRLIKAKAAPKWLPVASAAVIALILVGAVVLGVTVKKTTDEQNAQKQAALSSCLDGNQARVTNRKIWDEFLTLLVDNPNIAKTRAAVTGAIAALNLPPAETRAFDVIIDANWVNNPADVKIVQMFENYIAQNELAQNCHKLYGYE